MMQSPSHYFSLQKIWIKLIAVEDISVLTFMADWPTTIHVLNKTYMFLFVKNPKRSQTKTTRWNPSNRFVRGETSVPGFSPSAEGSPSSIGRPFSATKRKGFPYFMIIIWESHRIGILRFWWWKKRNCHPESLQICERDKYFPDFLEPRSGLV